MLLIDGSHGEGGGQVVRTSVALSVVTGRPFRMTGIRANRPNPGLMPQHLACVKAACALCGGRAQGLSEGSSSLQFEPGREFTGVLAVDVGTAGSAPLVLQCLMLAALGGGRELEARVTGGTDVSWSPPVDYVRAITLRFLARMGYAGSVGVGERGYFPRGGGTVEFSYRPSALRPVRCTEPPRTGAVQGVSHCSGLPRHVAERQAEACANALAEHGVSPAELEVEASPGRKGCAGSGVCAWSVGSYVGGSALGAPGRPAEDVGREAAGELLAGLRGGLSIDAHLSDQVIPYLALAPGSEATLHDTPHVRTSIEVVRRFLGDVLDARPVGFGALLVGSRGGSA